MRTQKPLKTATLVLNTPKMEPWPDTEEAASLLRVVGKLAPRQLALLPGGASFPWRKQFPAVAKRKQYDAGQCVDSALQAAGRRFIRSFERGSSFESGSWLYLKSGSGPTAWASQGSPSRNSRSKLKGGWEGPRSPLLILSNVGQICQSLISASGPI